MSEKQPPEAAAPGDDPENPGGSPSKAQKQSTAEFDKEVQQLQKQWKPSDAEITEANSYGRDKAAGFREGKWMSLCMPAKDMTSFGAGIQLQFTFNLGFLRLMWFFTFCAAPYIVFCYLGENLTTGGYVPSAKEGSPFEYIARTSAPNIGSAGTVDDVSYPRTVPFFEIDPDDGFFVPVDIHAKDVGFVVSSVDALCMLLLFLVLLWYEKRVIPAASTEHRLTESFSLYVDCLPSRLPDADHYNYKELLHRHFGRVLRAHLHPEGKQVVPGLQVIKRDDPGQEDYTEPRCCGRKWCCRRWSPYDAKGRHIGKVVKDKASKELKVRWRPLPGEKGKGALEDLKPNELFDLSLKKRIEFELAKENFVEEDIMVHEISLVRDYGGQLKNLRQQATKRKTERAKAEAAMEAHPEKKEELLKKLTDQDEKEMSERKESFEKAKEMVEQKKIRKVPMSSNIPTEERDVLGAYIIFTRRRNRNFVFEEYRFSRTFLRFTQSKGFQFYGNKIRLKEATDPSEVFWENMDVTAAQQFFRMVLVALVAIAVVLVSVFFFSAAKQAAEVAKGYGDPASCDATQVYVDACLPNTDCECVSATLFGVIQDKPAGVKACCEEKHGDDPSWLDQQLQAQYLTQGSSIAPAVMNALITMIIHGLAYALKKQTLTETNVSVMFMTVVMLLINMVACVIMVQCRFGSVWYNWVESWLGSENIQYFPVGTGMYSDATPTWYVDVGAVVVFTLCVSAFTLPAAMPASYMIFLVCKQLLKGRQKDNQSLKALFTKPEYNLALISAQDTVMIVACISFSAGFPALWAVLAIYLTLSYWIKRFTFLRGSREPPHFSYHLAKMSVVYIQIAVLIHCFFGVRVFSQPDTLESDMTESFYGDLGYNTTRSSSMMSMADDVWVVGDFAARTDYVNTHPQFFVIAIVIITIVIRLVFFIFGQGVYAVSTLFAAMLADVEGSHSTGCCGQCIMKLRENCFGRCMVGFFGLFGRLFTWIASCLADWLPGKMDTVLAEPFHAAPLKVFKDQKIPHSYDMKNYAPEMVIVLSGKAQAEEGREDDGDTPLGASAPLAARGGPDPAPAPPQDPAPAPPQEPRVEAL